MFDNCLLCCGLCFDGVLWCFASGTLWKLNDVWRVYFLTDRNGVLASGVLTERNGALAE